MFLLNYADEKVEIGEPFDDDISTIAVATIMVLTGDEVLDIVYKDGSSTRFSAYSAFEMFYDGEYDIIRDGEWIVNRESWESRKDSDPFRWYKYQ